MGTFRKCKRKAYLQTVVGAERSEKSYLGFGTITHKCIEYWLKFGLLPPTNGTTANDFIMILMQNGDEIFEKLGRDLTVAEVIEAGMVATKGLHLLPVPSSNLVVEEPFEIVLSRQDAPGLSVIFRSHGIDLYDHGPIGTRRKHADGTPITLHDQKTCKTLGFVPSPEDMREDVQAISYARSLMQRYYDFESDSIGCRWNYYPRSKDAAVAVDFKFTRAELEERWARIVADVWELKAFADAQTPWEQVPGNTEHCNDYGGCDFKGKCGALNQTNSDGPSLFKKGAVDMGLLDKARDGVKVGAAVTAPMPQSATVQVTASQSLFAQKVAANGMVPPKPGSLPPPQTTQQMRDTLQASLQAAGVEMAEDEGEGLGDSEDLDSEEVDTSAADVQTLMEGGTIQPTVAVEINPEASARVREILARTEHLLLPVGVDGSVFVGAVGINPPDAAQPSVTTPETKKKGKKGKAAAPEVITYTATPGQTIAQVIESLPAASLTLSPKDVSEMAENIAPRTLEFTLNDYAAEFVSRIRAYAETVCNTEAALEIFVLANKMERGEV